METARRQEDDIQDSWVELNTNGKNGEPVSPQSAYNGQMERLLIEAQKESRTPSPKLSPEGSPKNPDSPNNETDIQEERDPGTDWVWDWSSRPEIHPPSGYKRRLRHHSHALSVRKSGLFSLENLPTLIVTNVCSFLLGAAVLVICVKKKWIKVGSASE